jgi:hypothetical protein
MVCESLSLGQRKMFVVFKYGATSSRHPTSSPPGVRECDGREHFGVVLRVLEHRQCELVDIAQAFCLACLLARSIQSRQQHSCQDGDHDDHHEQFHEGETVQSFPHVGDLHRAAADAGKRGESKRRDHICASDPQPQTIAADAVMGGENSVHLDGYQLDEANRLTLHLH